MIYLISSAIFGIAVGIFSIKYQKTFLMLLFAIPPAFFFALKMFAPFAKVVAVSGVGNGGPLSVFSAMYNQFPEDIQLAIIIFLMAVIISRLVTWIVSKFVKPKAGESPADRKKRILKEYGYKNGLPY